MKEHHSHFVLFKPDGYLSQFIGNEHWAHKKKMIGEFYDFPKGTMPIGRLDEGSEGLLLLTTDGKLSYHINTSGIEKEYYAQVDGQITEQALESLQNGLKLTHQGKNYATLPSKAKAIPAPDLPKRNKSIRGPHHGPTSWASITLTEGRYRQVRKMTAAVGFPTLRLVRIRIGDLHTKDMQPGQVRELTKADLIRFNLFHQKTKV